MECVLCALPVEYSETGQLVHAPTEARPDVIPGGSKHVPETAEDNKLWSDACRIAYPGAVNITVIAGTITEHARWMTRAMDTRPAAKHPAMRILVGQLAFLCGLSLGPDDDALDECKKHAKRLDLPWV